MWLGVGRKGGRKTGDGSSASSTQRTSGRDLPGNGGEFEITRLYSGRLRRQRGVGGGRGD